MEEDEIVFEIEKISPAEFYKSMDSFKAKGFWQDVYHHTICPGVGSVGVKTKAYVKLQISEDNSVIISFKQL